VASEISRFQLHAASCSYGCWADCLDHLKC